MSDEADRLIAAALRDHARIPAPPGLRRTLEQRYLARRRRWITPIASGCIGAVLAAAIVLLVVRRPTQTQFDPAVEAMGDHLRVLTAITGNRGLDVEVSDMHQVKPWFAGKLDFVPPVTFLGDSEFPLAGGDLAVFDGHKAAAFVYHRKLHVISLFVFEARDLAHEERTVHGFHVVTWGSDGFGFALVSDVNLDDLRALEARLQAG